LPAVIGPIHKQVTKIGTINKGKAIGKKIIEIFGLFEKMIKNERRDFF